MIFALRLFESRLDLRLDRHVLSGVLLWGVFDLLELNYTGPGLKTLAYGV